MAKENITKFFDAAMTDKVLAEKLAALAAEHGYGFTAADLPGTGDKADSPTDTDSVQSLSDTEAESVSGGRVHSGYYTI